MPFCDRKPWDESHGYHQGSLRDFLAGLVSGDLLFVVLAANQSGWEMKRGLANKHRVAIV
jgi:hypothetical protein